MKNFEVKKYVMERCNSIAENLLESVEYREQQIKDQKALPENERGWQYDSIPDWENEIAACKQIIAHLEKLI